MNRFLRGWTMRIAFPALFAMACAAVPAGAQNVVKYFHLDAVGNVRAVTDEAGNVVERHDYLPFGEECTTGACASNPGVNAGQTRKFTGKERDAETGLDYFGARYYGSKIGRFTSVDPQLDQQAALFNPQKWNRYAYGLNNPLRVVDPDGREPVKAQAGTIGGFVAEMNASKTQVGLTTGKAATEALMRMGSTEFGRHGLEPAATGPFNNSKNRYVYTEKGGWVDMVHFLFYAGKTYSAFVGGSDPIESAMKAGYHQEGMDMVAAPWSAYSYEDLPSDRLGAEFAYAHFRPGENISLGEQVQNFMQSLGATNPSKAPNWSSVPQKATHDDPTHTNYTAKPMFTK